VARIEFARAAIEDIARLEVTHSLPPDTRERIRRSVRSLERFPRLGRLLESGGWEGFRFLLGPWRWMVIVYEYYEEGDRVVVVTVQDGRSSTAATASRQQPP
jgi:plasmid stabilization system protein ParE